MVTIVDSTKTTNGVAKTHASVRTPTTTTVRPEETRDDTRARVARFAAGSMRTIVLWDTLVLIETFQDVQIWAVRP